jgi:hypothetical protein
MSDLHERLYAAIDSDPLDVIPIAEELLARAMKAEATIERVRALHSQGVMPDMCKECCHVPAADCPTIRALDAPESPADVQEGSE